VHPEAAAAVEFTHSQFWFVSLVVLFIDTVPRSIFWFSFFLQVAIIWEGDEPGMVKHITYNELLREVCRLSNVLLNAGVRKGEAVNITTNIKKHMIYQTHSHAGTQA